MQDWLDYIESLHPEEIELGLDRVKRVFRNLHLDLSSMQFITVAGTNGKGSTLAMLESIYIRAGYEVGSYISPHLIHYNERVRLDGSSVRDEVLCSAFESVEAARGDISLTYFEFGTLAALKIFSANAPDVVLLETGLGGRLDAVNIIDADLAIVTSVALDHMEWLGESREEIGREKAGIFRKDRPAICSDPFPPESLLEIASEVGAPLHLIGRDFRFERGDESWCWQGSDWVLENLPLPALAGEHQLLNASATIAAVEQLRSKLPVEKSVVSQGLLSLSLAGRIEVIDSHPQLLLDVSHNPQAVAALASYIDAHAIPGNTHAVVGMMKDKEIGQALVPLKNLVDHWYVTGLPGTRGATAERLATELQKLQVSVPVDRFESALEALQVARQQAAANDRILVFGSFVTVGAIMVQL